MIEEIEIYIGENKLEPYEMKNYICINDYVGDIVNEVYYQYCHERKPVR